MNDKGDTRYTHDTNDSKDMNGTRSSNNSNDTHDLDGTKVTNGRNTSKTSDNGNMAILAILTINTTIAILTMTERKQQSYLTHC